MPKKDADDPRMQKVIDLLDAAPPSVLPDPKVAAVIFDGSDRPIAQYSKTRFGEPHSEAQAVLRAFQWVNRRARGPTTDCRELLMRLRSMFHRPGFIRSERDLDTLRRLREKLGDPLREMTLMTNLEPCSHFGKNPACASVIVASGIRRVKFAHFDPDPDVQGKGYNILQVSGVSIEYGSHESEAMQANSLFLQIASFMPRLFEGIHPTASPKEPPHVMLGLHVPKSEVRSRNHGRSIDIHTFGVPPRRTMIRSVPQRGRPKLRPSTVHKLPIDIESVVFTTLLNPPAIVEMLSKKFRSVPGTIVSAVPDMSYEFGKEESIAILKEYFPRTHVCVGVRMSAIKDKLARISLRRRLMAEKSREGIAAIVVLGKGIPPDQNQRVESRMLDLISATTLHVSRLEEYLIMLRFLQPNIKITIFLGGDLCHGRWKQQMVENLRKLMVGRENFTLRCTNEEAVSTLREAGVPRVSYLEPYWEIVT